MRINDPVVIHAGVFARTGVNLAKGAMLDLRVSSTARYSASFTPSYPASVDASTLLYYPMNEGSGPTSFDAIGSPPDVTWTNPNDWRVCFTGGT